MGQEMSEDISVLSPDDRCADQGGVCRAVVATVSARCSDCITSRL